MIIAIPADTNAKDTPVCASFGRAPYYLFHNTQTGETRFLENPAAQAAGGAGVKAAQFLVDRKVNTIITPRAGQNAAEVLSAANIKIMKASGVAALDQLAEYEQGKLAPLDHFHAGFHGHA